MSSVSPHPLDTSEDIWRRMVAMWRVMPTAEKARVVKALTAGSLRMAKTGILERYPNATDDEVRLRLGALRIPPDLMKAAYGWDPDVRGR